MSVEFDQVHPQDKLSFSFKVDGKRIVVRMSDELYQDSYLNSSESRLIDIIQSALLEEKQRILREYADKKSDSKDPKYTLTTQGLV